MPKKEAGKEKIDIFYTLNPNDGILEARALVLSTKKWTGPKQFGFDFSSNSDKSIIDGEVEEIIENWENSSLSNIEFQATITLAEKQLSNNSNSKLEKLLNSFKKAMVDEDKDETRRLDEEINDLLFDLDN